MTVAVTFACGHRAAIDPSKGPVCPTCGETRVSQCHAPAPRFTGHAIGPHVTTRHLGPVRVDLTQKEPTHG